MSILLSLLHLKNINRGVSVTTTVKEIVGRSSQRVSYTITNTGTDIVYLGFDTALTALNGEPLNVNEMIMFTRIWGDDAELGCFALAKSGTQTLIIIESMDLA